MSTTWSLTYSIPKLGLKLLNNESKTSRDLMQHAVTESPMRLWWDLLLRMPSCHFQFQKRVKVIWVFQNRPQNPHFSLWIRCQTTKSTELQIPHKSNHRANAKFLKWGSCSSIDDGNWNKIAKKTERFKPKWLWSFKILEEENRDCLQREIWKKTWVRCCYFAFIAVCTQRFRRKNVKDVVSSLLAEMDWEIF